MEWMGPLLSLNENTAGALGVTLWPSEGTAAGVMEEKEHLSNRPPSEPTKKVSESQGDRAMEVTPTVLLPRAYGQQNHMVFFTHTAGHKISLGSFEEDNIVLVLLP